MGFHSLKVKGYINTLERLEQRALGFSGHSRYPKLSKRLMSEDPNLELNTVPCSTIDFR